MKLKILRAAALLIIISTLVSCSKHYRTDNKRPAHRHYRKAGRAW